MKMNLYYLHSDPSKLDGDPSLFDQIEVAEEMIYFLTKPVDDCFSWYRKSAAWYVWVEIEDYLYDNPNNKKEMGQLILSLGFKGARLMMEYAKEVIKRRWPEAEKYIKQDSELWQEYMDDMSSL